MLHNKHKRNNHAVKHGLPINFLDERSSLLFEINSTFGWDKELICSLSSSLWCESPFFATIDQLRRIARYYRLVEHNQAPAHLQRAAHRRRFRKNKSRVLRMTRAKK